MYCTKKMLQNVTFKQEKKILQQALQQLPEINKKFH